MNINDILSTTDKFIPYIKDSRTIDSFLRPIGRDVNPVILNRHIIGEHPASILSATFFMVGISALAYRIRCTTRNNSFNELDNHIIAMNNVTKIANNIASTHNENDIEIVDILDNQSERIINCNIYKKIMRTLWFY